MSLHSMKHLSQSKFVLILIFFARLALGNTILDTSDYIQKINELNEEFVKYIETRMDTKISSIKRVLQEGSAEEQISAMNHINEMIAEMVFKLRETAKQQNTVDDEEERLIEVIAPGNFLAAFNVIADTLQRVFRTYIHPRRVAYSGRNMFECVDVLLNRTALSSTETGLSTYMGRRTFTEEEFVVLVEHLAPNINKELTSEIGVHRLPFYSVGRKNLRFYYEDTINYFHKVLWLVRSSGIDFFEIIKQEIEKEYGLEKVETIIEEFSLILCRDYYLANDIKHSFWYTYTRKLMYMPQDEFDDALDMYYVEGWFFERRNVAYFNLLTKALRRCKAWEQKVVLDLEFLPFMRNPKIGIPQLWSCNQTGRT